MYIWKMAIDNAGPYAIKPVTDCRRIEIRENFNSTNPPTADLNLFDQTDSAGARGARVPQGTSAILTSPRAFSPTVPAAYINTATGSITIAVIEHEFV